MTEGGTVSITNVIEALERLVAIAHSDTVRARRVADFLVACWNAYAFAD
ncbi:MULTISPECIES: hypothetical protein [unclassified Mesorhizobium]|nr:MULTISPECIES: hypothetical protein [unclassified Mesorhizobium]ESY26356.1 hypothetical protein X751_00560 [Mesorhizobium sp. LNJC395A00]WJI74979.1 hypothetical protein NLY37_29605 [Mesorhizobium sp. C395A]